MDSKFYSDLSKQLATSYKNLEEYYLLKNTGESNTIQSKLEDIRRKEQAIKLKQNEDSILSLNNPNMGLEQIPNIQQLEIENKLDPRNVRMEYNSKRYQRQRANYLKSVLRDRYGDEYIRGLPNIGINMGELLLQNIDDIDMLMNIKEYMKDNTRDRSEDGFNFWLGQIRGEREEKREEFMGRGADNNALMLLMSYINGNDNPILKKQLKKVLKKI